MLWNIPHAQTHTNEEEHTQANKKGKKKLYTCWVVQNES